jgi:hypothetical protein
MQDGAHFTATQLLEIKECFSVHPVVLFYKRTELELCEKQLQTAEFKRKAPTADVEVGVKRETMLV